MIAAVLAACIACLWIVAYWAGTRPTHPNTRKMEAALARFADRGNWAEQERVATCGCRFIEWCDDDTDPHPWEVARDALTASESTQQPHDGAL